MLIINEYNLEYDSDANIITFNSDSSFHTMLISSIGNTFINHNFDGTYLLEVRHTRNKRGIIEFKYNDIFFKIKSYTYDSIEDVMYSPKEIIKAINDKNKQ